MYVKNTLELDSSIQVIAISEGDGLKLIDYLKEQNVKLKDSEYDAVVEIKYTYDIEKHIGVRILLPFPFVNIFSSIKVIMDHLFLSIIGSCLVMKPNNLTKFSMNLQNWSEPLKIKSFSLLVMFFGNMTLWLSQVSMRMIRDVFAVDVIAILNLKMVIYVPFFS